MLERNARLMNRKLVEYLIPSVLMVIAMQFGSLLDGILVGNMLSNEALTATSLVMPILLILQFPGFALGVGGSIIAGQYMGKRELDKASKVFSGCIIAGMAISCLFMVIAPFTAAPFASVYVPSEMKELGTQYVLVYMLSIPILNLAIMMSSFMSEDSHPNHASALLIIANVVKVGAEILMLRVFRMGMYGAALSTTVGYLVGLVTLWFYHRSKSRMLQFSMHIRGCWPLLKESLKAASATALSMVLMAVQMSVANILIANMVTDPTEQLLFGIISNFVFAFDLFVGGISQLVPNICSILHGEEDYYGLRAVTARLYYLNIIITLALTVFLMIDPGFYCALFGLEYHGGDGFRIMRIFLLSFLPYEINKFNQAYYSTIGRNTPALVTVLLREGILNLPLTVILLQTRGLEGYAWSQTLSEIGTVVLTYAYILFYNRSKKNDHYGLWMIPPFKNQFPYDVSIHNQEDQVAQLSRELVQYSKDRGMSERNSQIIGLAGEELAMNIITYGLDSGKDSTIDVHLKIVNERMILRIRDDGKSFDPTQYKPEGEPDTTSGLYLINGLVSKMTYLRVLNTNNTIMEIELNQGGN